MSRPQAEAFFLSRDEHSLFCLLFSPPPGRFPVGSILHVPAFAEEMNKSRRAVVNTARQLADQGWQVLLFDLHGTGDSSGEFGDASWPGWLADVRATFHWLRERCGTKPVAWGLRAGCLLIDDVQDELDMDRLIFWQPVLVGDAALRQFLRLRAVGAAAGSGAAAKETTAGLLGELQAGATIEVAGYALPPGIALPMRRAGISAHRYRGKQIVWLETSVANPPACSPASLLRISELEGGGALVSKRAVSGVSFWMTQEIDEATPLVSATIDASATLK